MNYMDILHILQNHKKFIKIWKPISNENLKKDEDEINTWIALCKKEGFNFQQDYLGKINIAYHYSKCCYHNSKPNTTLLDNILSGNRIYLDNYEYRNIA